ncbi:MAG: M56 family metallopeptidase [Clostridia bacterium]|nr:M56 family metallopeptidase [Clostridia bacterium]
MTEFFLHVVNRSISASYVVLAVLLCRLLLKKAPKWILVFLWGIVAIRLVVPFSVESAFSLNPGGQTIDPEVVIQTHSPAIDSGVPVIDAVIEPVIEETKVTVAPEKEVNLFRTALPYGAGIWLLGIGGMLCYGGISYQRVKRRVGTAVQYSPGIYQSENVVSPFVLGFFSPRIYLPYRIGERDREHVIAHERAHIARRDHLWKPLGYVILALHWFNPLLWLGYVLLCRDIELACDEKVIKHLSGEEKADYTQALLTCSVNRRVIAACPLAFGEVGIKTRIQSVLHYKKPAFWVIVAAILAGIAVAVCFLTDPKKGEAAEDDGDGGEAVSEEGSEPQGGGFVTQSGSEELLTVEKLREKHPEFFGLSTDGGLTVYIWQFGKDSYRCHLANTLSEAVSDNRFAFSSGVSITQMRTILTTYEIEKKDVTVQAVHNPLSSYYYVIDEAYRERVEELFWSTLPFSGPPQTIPVIDTASFDIDYDGRIEVCTLRYGPTSGVFTFMLSVTENGLPEYFNLYEARWGDLSFAETEDGVKLCLAGATGEEDTYYSFAVREGNVVLSSPEETLSFWGPQGLSSPYAPQSGHALSATIGDAIREEFRAKMPDGLFHTQSYKILGLKGASGTPPVGGTLHSEQLFVYLAVYHAEFRMDGSLTEVRGGLAPTLVILRTEEDGGYELTDCLTEEEPNFKAEMQKLFPEAFGAIKPEEYRESLKEECLRQAKDYAAGL